METTFFAVLTPLLPSYRDDLGLGDAEVGVLSGSFAAGTLLMALPGGWFAARYGPRRAMIVGVIGVGIFSTAFGFADRIEVLDLTRFLQGAFGALMWAGAISWAIAVAPRARRGQVMGTIIAAAVVGEMLGSPIGALAHAVGTEIVFSSVLILAIGITAVAMTIPPASEVERQPVDEALAAARRARFARTALVLAGPSAAFGMVVVVGPLRLDDLGATPWMIAGAFAGGSLVEALIGPWVGKFSDRVGRRLPYVAGLIVMSVAIAVVGMFSILPMLLIGVLLVAFGAGLAFTPASTLITDAATNAGLNQGYAAGAANVAWGGGQMVGAVGAGYLAGVAGYALPAVVMIAVLGVVWLIVRPITAQPLPNHSAGIVES
jgi:DHA1 family multidrug resistance protein-like MFS transporter